MRMIILFLILSNALVLQAQKFEVSFSQCVHFKKGKSLNYENLFQPNGFKLDQIQKGQNYYVFDLTNQEALFYYRGNLVRKIAIKKSVVEGDLVKVEVDDYDINDGSMIPVYCVLNISDDYSVYPYFMLYYQFDGEIEGNVVYEK